MLRWYAIPPLINRRFVGKCRKISKCFSVSSQSTNPSNLTFHANSIDPSWTSLNKDSPPSGLEAAMVDYIFGKKKATEVAHSIWDCVVQKGDTVVDATCGNGHDTLAMVNMVSDKSLAGRVYAMDIQETAIKNTMSLLDRSLGPDKIETVAISLSATCHSKMEDLIPRGVAVRLVAFNLGYLPGGDKAVITTSETTLFGMEAASRILAPGGLISMMVYLGHPGGMEEFERVEAFASGLTVNNWVCCKLQTMNRPLAPVLVLLYKRR